jgi:SAM-dependent methyltransferase
MSPLRHGKLPNWYNKDSEYFDEIHENRPSTKLINRTVEKILKKYRVKTVLDLTCGTGSQVFWLAKRGYNVTGSDISQGMLKIARGRAKKEKISVRLLKGDMRTIKVGSFDAAITIFNAVGHLTKAGFEKAMRNIRENLNFGGIYVFDIANLSYVRDAGNIADWTIDWIRTIGDTKLRKIQYSIINKKGVTISYTTNYVQKGSGEPKISKHIGTLQLYTAKELKELLTRNGFEVLGQYGMDGSKFSEKKTKSILTVAKKSKCLT